MNESWAEMAAAIVKEKQKFLDGVLRKIENGTIEKHIDKSDQCGTITYMQGKKMHRFVTQQEINEALKQETVQFPRTMSYILMYESIDEGCDQEGNWYSTSRWEPVMVFSSREDAQEYLINSPLLQLKRKEFPEYHSESSYEILEVPIMIREFI